jgi:hypothetical protein
MLRILWLALLALSACEVAPSAGPCSGMDAATCAISHFESVVGVGKIGDACTDTVMSAQFVNYGPAYLQWQCGSSVPCVGCVLDYRADGPQIGLATSDMGQTTATAAHELMHVILECTSSDHDPDPGHRKDVWGNLN